MQTKTKLTGGQIIVETLIREGVPYIVGIPGHGTLGLSDALIEQNRRGEPRARPLKVLQVRHEQAAVHLPELFPFRFTLTVDHLRAHPWFVVQRQGAGWDMVRVVSRGGDQ